MAGYRFEQVGLGYVCEWPDQGISVSVDRLHRSREGLTAEVLVEAHLPGVPPHLHQARVNLTSTSSRNTLAKYLESRTDGLELDWPGLLEVVCVNVLRREREGDPIIRVGRLEQAVEERWRVEGLVPEGKVTIFYGDGGSCKSMTALALGLSIKTGLEFVPGFRTTPGEVLYLDWESDQEDIDQRIKLLAAGLGVEPPEISYRACVGPLVDQVEDLARYVAAERVGLVIVDSVGMAMAGTEEGRDANESTIRLFSALRALRTTAICIDHITNEARERKGKAGRPYGSAYKLYLARAVYEIKRSRDAADDWVHVGIFHTKRNRGGALARPIGLRIQFAPDAIRYRRESIDDPELVSAMSLADRMVWALKRRAMSYHEVAEELEEPENKIRAIYSQDQRRQRPRFQKLPDGRLALRADGEPSARPAPTARAAGDEELPW